MQISITFEGIEQLFSGLNRIDGLLDDLSPFFEKFADERYEEERRLFDSAPWPALSPVYAARKRQIFGDKPILRATDTLFRSLTEKGAPGNVHRIERQFAEVSSAVSYGVFHIPERDPRAEPNVDRYELIAAEQLEEMLKAAGFN
jgi:hypothetical protein